MPLPTGQLRPDLIPEQELRESVREDPDTGCWIWTRATDTSGYAQLRRKGITQRMHRLAYHYWVGPIPDGLNILHRCDTPPCINPRHLWAGTHTDNMRDKARKGRVRAPWGERCGKSKLNTSAVNVMRWMRFVRGMEYTRIAGAYGMSPGTVRKACIGRTWKQLPYHPTVATAMENAT